MAIKYTLSKKENGQKQVEILMRYKSGQLAARAKSGIFVLPDWFSFVIGETANDPFKGKKKWEMGEKEIQKYHNEKKEELAKLRNQIDSIIENPNTNRTNSEWLKTTVNSFHYPIDESANDAVIKQPFFDTFDEYLSKKNFIKGTRNHLLVLKRVLQRYEVFVSEYEGTPFVWDLDTMTAETLEDLESYFANEHTLYDEYRDMFDKFPAITNSKRKTHRPQQKGGNTINNLLRKLRMFVNWCIANEKTNNNPFKKFILKPAVYGTPYYITLEDRNKIYNTDLSHDPQLAIQRDIFVFQCVIGCRISDLYSLTKDSVIEDGIEYIAQKTKGKKAETTRVPFIDLSREIFNRYKDIEGERLFPFIAETNYNKAIKEIFTLAEITKMVTVLNPITREQEKKPINEEASSHLARKTFIGNLYKKVKDPNIIGKMSGHSEGSKAFARYRDIDEEMMKETVNLLT